MRLPSHVLTKLYLAGVVGACEPANQAEPEPEQVVESKSDSTPLRDVVRMTDDDRVPAVAPRFPAQPQPQPQKPQPPPPPNIKPKPKRHVWASSCGHMQRVEANASLKECGKG